MISIKTNAANKVIVTNLKNKFNFKDEAVIARIAIAFSLQKLTKFDVKPEVLDNSGKEYKGYTLFNKYYDENLSKILFNQHYQKIITNDEYEKLLKLHLDDGLSKLNQLIYNQNKNHIDILTETIKDGLQLLDATNSSMANKNSIDACNNEIIFDIGTINNDENSKEKLLIAINNQDKYSNQHIAIAGATGSGKTEFVKDLLWQANKASGGELKFIFFDPKGEGKSEKLKPFLESTNCQFVDVSKNELNFNPLSYIDLVDEDAQRIEIQNFRDTIASINSSTGPAQKGRLTKVLHKSFIEAKKTGEHPTLATIRNDLEAFYEEQDIKLDGFVNTFEDIANWFSKQQNTNIYEHNQYINLPASMPSSASQTIVFLMLNYLKNIFISCEDTESDNSIKPMRYIIVIDEAHVYLKNKKAREILESLLRLIRSKGVMVILMTQGVEDYKQKDFDFASQIGASILLDIKDTNNNKYIQSFFGVNKNNRKLSTKLDKLAPKKGIICVDEPHLIDINLFFNRR